MILHPASTVGKNWTCVSMYYDVKCLCGNSTNKETRRDIEAQSGDKSVFTVQTKSFLLTGDLQLWPDSSTSLLQCLKLSGIVDTRILEERTLVVGFKEVNLCHIELLVFLPLIRFITLISLFSSDIGAAQGKVSFQIPVNRYYSPQQFINCYFKNKKAFSCIG